MSLARSKLLNEVHVNLMFRLVPCDHLQDSQVKFNLLGRSWASDKDPRNYMFNFQKILDTSFIVSFFYSWIGFYGKMSDVHMQIAKIEDLSYKKMIIRNTLSSKRKIFENLPLVREIIIPHVCIVIWWVGEFLQITWPNGSQMVWKVWSLSLRVLSTVT